MAIRAAFRAAGSASGALGMKRVHSATDFEVLVTDATADAPGARDTVAKVAGKIAGAAATNVAALTLSSSGAQSAQASVAASIGVLPVKDFRRGSNAKNGRDVSKARPGTRIPVALVVADHPMSKWFEYGHGRSFPITRFMRNAGIAGNSSGGIFRARGRGR